MTRDEIINKLVSEIIIMTKGFNVDEELLTIYCNDVYDMTCSLTKYDLLPISFVASLKQIIIEALFKHGEQGVKSSSSLGTNKTYVYDDLEQSVRKKFANKINAFALVGKR